METLQQQLARQCRHFNGIQHGRCEAGIEYQSVIARSQPLDRRFPCLRANDEVSTCALVSPKTDEEIDAEVAEIEAVTLAFTDALVNDTCPHCQTKITNKRQVGRCVYADPCGHRLYQGQL